MCEDGIQKKSVPCDHCHHLASLVMPIGEFQNRFYYPTLTHMMDSYYPVQNVHLPRADLSRVHLPLIQEELLSVTCTEYWLTTKSKLAE